jgi:putative ABC transport system permease protein
VVVRTDDDPRLAIPALRGLLHDADPDAIVDDVATLESIVDAAVAPWRFTVWFLGTLAACSSLLVVVALFTTATLNVQQRRQEFAVRMAVGATGPQIRNIVLRHAITRSLAGLVIGCAVALAGTRLAAALLYGVQSTDPFTFAAVAAMMFLVTLAATYSAASRAARTDPSELLRGT